MTIRFSKPTMGDKILACCGKSRAVRIPADVYQKFGPYVSVCAEKESFLCALSRPKNQDPPKGWFYMDDIIPDINDQD